MTDDWYKPRRQAPEDGTYEIKHGAYCNQAHVSSDTFAKGVRFPRCPGICGEQVRYRLTAPANVVVFKEEVVKKMPKPRRRR